MERTEWKDVRDGFGGYQALYAAQAGLCETVAVPAVKAIALDGCGSPAASDAFGMAVEALYSTYHTIKKSLDTKGSSTVPDDFGIPPLEALWRMDEVGKPFDINAPDHWAWTVLLPVPGGWMDRIETEKIPELCQAQGSNRVRLLSVGDEWAVQTLHIGSYMEEAVTLQRLKEYAEEKGLTIAGEHHEIYLNDPSRTPVEEWKTVLRYKVVRT